MDETVDILLARWRDGDSEAGNAFVGRVYADLRRLAAYYFRNERVGHTLQPMAVVHELYLRLSEGDPVEWQDRVHFFAVASRQIRRILIDHARKRGAAKRSDSMLRLPGQWPMNLDPRLERLFAVDEALAELERHEPRATRVVELRVFGGLTESEAAKALDVSVATVKRDWAFARAWLKDRLKSDTENA